MLPRLDNTVRPIAVIEAPSAVGAIASTKQEVASRLELLAIGKPVQGEILSKLNDGTFFVKLAGATARMALPQNTKVGDSIPLTLVALTPRPTFLLEGAQGETTTALFSRQDLVSHFLQDNPTEQARLPLSDTMSLETGKARAESVAAAKTLVVDGKTVIADLPDTQASSAPTNLSTTGKLIDSILKEAQQHGASNALVNKSPLLQNMEELRQPEKLAAHLQQTMSSSGLFYESHVANWADGKLPLAELQREPQAQLGNVAANASLNSTGQKDQLALTQMIHLQLETLEQQKIVWQGKLLPDMPFDWDIKREPRQAQDSSDQNDAAPSWQSTVRFELPQLGTVAATINMHAGHLQLLIRTNSATTVQSLQEYAPVLADALQHIDMSLESFSVKQDEQT
ncbi:hypothetical protein BH11PSE12_BH11PSE12_02390 [soil metagenome]